MTETSLIAWATTSTNTIGADAGISVERTVMEDGVVRESNEVAAKTVDLALDSEDEGWLNEDAADYLLTEMGYAKITPWRESGGQWAAQVEKS